MPDRFNPYAPGAANPPPLLAGRDEWRRRFAEYLEAATNGHPFRVLIFSGLRGVGKTVLLTELRDMARERRWAAVRLEAQQGTRLSQTLGDQAETLVAELPGGRRRVTSRLRSLVEAVTLTFDSTGAVKAQIEGPRPTRAERQLHSSVRDLFLELGRAAQAQSVGVALLLDELQEADPVDLRAIGLALQATTEDRLPVLAAGAGLPTLPAYFKGAVSYAERFQFAEIGALGEADAAAALTEPAQQQGVQFQPVALRRVLAAAGGYPFLLQLYGRHAWDAARGADVITAAHAEQAEAAVGRELHLGVFGGRWSQSTNTERRYLTAMAVLGDGPVRSGDVAAMLGVATSAVSQYRQRLIDKGVIFGAEDRTVCFTLPRFGRYVLERAVSDELDIPPAAPLASRLRALVQSPEPSDNSQSAARNRTLPGSR